MRSRQDLMLEALENSPVAFTSLLQKYHRKDKTIFLIVEGKDDATYYLHYVEANLLPGWRVEPIIAGNKQNVLKVLKEVDWRTHKRYRILFFVDRDYDDFYGTQATPYSNLYLTDGYSIENSLCTDQTFLTICMRATNSKNGLSDDEKNELQNIFTTAIKSIRTTSQLIVACQLLWKLKEYKLNNNNLHMKKVISFSKGKPSILLSENELVALLSTCLKSGENLPDISVRERQEYIKKHINRPIEMIIRGKYLAEIFRMLVLSLENFTLSSGNRIRGFSNTSSNILNLCLMHSPMPDSLKLFVANNLQKCN